MVQAQGCKWDGGVYADDDKGWCEEWDVLNVLDVCVKEKRENNMVVRKNSKKKMDVAKEENGERLIIY